MMDQLWVTPSGSGTPVGSLPSPTGVSGYTGEPRGKSSDEDRAEVGEALVSRA